MSSKSESIQSIDRALDIIEALAIEPKGLGVTELAKRVELHKSTAYRIILTLAERGYLDKTEEGNYKVGLKLIGAVSCYINSLELQTEARPYLAQITADLGLTSHLGVLDGDQVVYVEKMDVISSVKLYSQIGLHVPAFCSSLGKCILAKYSTSELEQVMKGCRFINYTKNTIPDMDALRVELAKVRQQGWGMDNEEYEEGHRCIGAPVYDYRGDIIAAVSASGSKNLLTDDRINEVATYVMKIASELSSNMGYGE